MPTPRPNVAAIPAYVPGRPPPDVPGLTSFKLSSNENPYPPLPGVLDAVNATLETLNRYPDMGTARLFGALSERWNLPVDQFAVGTGSVALIYQLLAAFCEPGDEVVHAWRSFEAYPIAIAAAAAVSVPVGVDAEGRHDLDAMAAAITDRTRVVLVCTPNNPTGPAVGAAELQAFLARVPDDVLVVIDEAYVEFVRPTDPDDRLDALALMRGSDRIAVFRTFSKAYGLAALRVGFAMAPAPIAAALRAVSLPFGISTAAEAAAIASLAAEDELAARVDALVGERLRVVSALADAGIAVPEPQGNFVWFALGTRTADFAAAAEQVGLVVRPFAGEGCRCSIGEPEANDRLISLATSFLTDPGAG